VRERTIKKQVEDHTKETVKEGKSDKETN